MFVSDVINSSITINQINSQYENTNQIKSNDRISDISIRTLSESNESKEKEAIQLKQLFTLRYRAPHPWPESFPDAELDCEGFAHYLMTGNIGNFEEIQKPTINKINLKNTHKPYTCYEIWQPNAPWARANMGFWGPVHFFTHLEKGKYISKNGCGPIRIFSSFEEMLKKDAFPFGFVTEDYQTTNEIEQATIGESIIGTIHG